MAAAKRDSEQSGTGRTGSQDGLDSVGVGAVGVATPRHGHSVVVGHRVNKKNWNASKFIEEQLAGGDVHARLSVRL